MGNQEYKRKIIQGYRVLVGNPPLLEVPLCNLEVGNKVFKIGCLNSVGNESSSCRVFEPDLPFKYSGQYIFEGVKYAAFLIYPSGISGWNLFTPKQNAYSLWVINETDNEIELILQKLKSQTIGIYRAIFNE